MKSDIHTDKGINFSRKYNTILSVYALSNRASKYIQHKLIQLRGEVDKPIHRIGDFNIPLPTTDKTSDRIIMSPCK